MVISLNKLERQSYRAAILRELVCEISEWWVRIHLVCVSSGCVRGACTQIGWQKLRAVHLSADTRSVADGELCNVSRYTLQESERHLVLVCSKKFVACAHT